MCGNWKNNNYSNVIVFKHLLNFYITVSFIITYLLKQKTYTSLKKIKQGLNSETIQENRTFNKLFFPVSPDSVKHITYPHKSINFRQNLLKRPSSFTQNKIWVVVSVSSKLCKNIYCHVNF